MAFEDTPGQQDAVRALRALLGSDRLPHAFLFLGASGTGRLSTARELARVVLCSGKQQDDGHCGQCQNCRLMEAERHPDYHETGLPEARQSVPIGTVRELQHAAALKPILGTRRIFVIRDADRLSIEAANCFLKTLEEPPGGCVFVLIASSLRQIPETIISRCRMIRFRNLPPDVLQDELEAEQVEPGDARWLARRSWGSPGLARRLGDMELHDLNRKIVAELCAISPEDNFRLSDWLNGLPAVRRGSATESRLMLQELLECLALYYRDLAVGAAMGEEKPDLCNQALQDTMAKLTGGKPPEFFVEQAELVLETIERIGANANRQLALDHLFTELGRANGARA